MGMNLNLSSEEAQELRGLLSALSARAQRQVSFNELLGSWNQFVARVERGYEDSIYDYTNDLSVRDQLQELLTTTSTRLHEKLTAQVAPLDQRFLGATRQIKRPLLQSLDEEIGFWWFRIPKALGGELEDDLRSDGFLR